MAGQTSGGDMTNDVTAGVGADVQGCAASQGRRMDYLLLAALAVAAAMAMTWASSPRGMGVSPDSTMYLHAAQSLAQGRGLDAYSRQGEPIPMTHYPPLLSALIGLVSLCGVDLLTAARWLNIIAYAANAMIFGVLLYRITASRWTALIGEALWISSLAVVTVHSYVWTEPTFILLSWIALAALAAHISRPRWRWLIVAGAAAGLALLDRYVGAALILTGAATLLFWRKAGTDTDFKSAFGGKSVSVPVFRPAFPQRLAHIAVFCGLACAGMLAWLVRNYLVTSGNLTNRRFFLHPPTMLKYDQLVWTLDESMPVPPVVQGLCLQIVAVAVVVVFCWTAIRRPAVERTSATPSRLPHLAAIYIAAYMAFMVISQAFFDAAIHMDDRGLAPITGPIILLLVLLARRVIRLWKPGAVRTALVWAACLALAGVYSWRAFEYLRDMHDQGQGYCNSQWQSSDTVAHIRELPPGTVIFTNKIDAIMFLTGRRSADLPVKFDDITCRPGQSYQEDMAKLLKALRSSGGVIVCFDEYDKDRFPDRKTLEQALPLRVISTCRDGVIYGLAPDGT